MSDVIIISNLVVMVGLFVATLYRIKIEREQIKTTIQNAKYAEKFKMLHSTIEREKDEIMTMSRHDFIEFLEEVCKDED